MNIISKEDFLTKITEIRNECNAISRSRNLSMGIDYIDTGAFDAWRNKVLVFLKQFSFVPPDIIDSISRASNKIYSSIDAIKDQINALVDLIQKEYIAFGSTEKFDTVLELEKIFNRFHKVARQLRTRHSSRETLKIIDEYDVQDLLHALLLLYFDDVRAEEWTPSYAGGCERMDFLIKDIQTVVEVKKTRASMSPKDLGEELIIDIEKYQTHPDCKHLYCFVYDPEGLLGNPSGIKNDLERTHKDFLKVFIKPE